VVPFCSLTGLDKTINLALFVLVRQRIMNFGTLHVSVFNMLKPQFKRRLFSAPENMLHQCHDVKIDLVEMF